MAGSRVIPAQVSNSDTWPPRGRLLAGADVLRVGWLCPLFVHGAKARLPQAAG